MMSLAEATAVLTAPGQHFEMEELDIRGVPTRVWKNAPPTLRHILEASRKHDDALFLVYEDERTSFEDHFRAAAAVANALVERLGVAKGDRVAIAMRNFPEWAIAFWAAAAAGAVVVPLNAWWAGAELAYALDDCGAEVLFADQERVARLDEHWSDLPGLKHVVVARSRVTSEHIPFTDLLRDESSKAPLPDVSIDPEDDATIFYTSGTTGRPKGAVGTHRNICTNQLSLAFVNARNAVRAQGQAAPPGRSGQNAYLLSVPFFHATGCHSVLVANTLYGGKLVIMHKWDAGRALELIERERVTTFGGVPAMVMQVLDHPDFATRDLSSVKSVGYGGAPAPPDLVRRIKEHFPTGSPSNGYGLTETSSVTTMNAGDDYVRKPDSVGPPVPVCDVRIVGDDGSDVAMGEVGELWIKGPNVVRGYWNKPDATAAAFTEGWLHSGDVARIDDEGFVYIVDRAKDMVIRGGENVYCVEVEAALHEHPAVSDAAVIGVPHDVLGEEVGAVVQVRPGHEVTEQDLQSFVGERLAAFKVPVRIWFRDQPLPRNPAGKILKRELREELVG
ncbi:MAG: steroid-24-oyl-CoA synthetase [Acidimicrobiaceae bacterium]|jgi:long-chain acyl-CoA synthetase|nr:steroid-24-oyl-CoA synthetase [Acidimicrobiaceae bacterium]